MCVNLAGIYRYIYMFVCVRICVCVCVCAYKIKFDQTGIIYTGNKSEFKSHFKGLVPHTFSDESNKRETCIYIYNTYIRTK